MNGPDDRIERHLLREGFTRIAGVDEVGRGPLAGPVTAAAVVLDLEAVCEGLNDSKKLTARRRGFLTEQINESAEVSIAHATVEEIDEINILQASIQWINWDNVISNPECLPHPDVNAAPGFPAKDPSSQRSP